MSQHDRNFDDLALRFADKVYGGLKGQIRLAVIWRDLQQQLPDLIAASHSKSLRILDLGGGLGQIAIKLALQGHEIVFNDISPIMVEEAKQVAEEQGVADRFQWHVGPYQNLRPDDLGQFDLILCHAVLEWLDQPQDLVAALGQFCHSNTALSLCFYNPASKVYRNLICGNFKVLDKGQNYQSNTGSLTPNNPSEPDHVKQWLRQYRFTLQQVSGLRVFHDYVLEKRGGHQVPDDVLAMEVKYSQLEPYKWMGRYLHFFALYQG